MAKVSFEGIGEVMATFLAKSGTQAGQVVKVTANGEVGACTAGNAFCGVAAAVDDGLAAVQLGGFAELPSDGSVSLGWCALTADGSGGVKKDAANGREYLVAAIDPLYDTVTVLL